MRYQNKSNSILTMIQPKFKITKHSTPAEYQQIRKYVIDSVLESGCAPKRLASMREMAGFFKVSTATVQRALKELVDDDYLTVKPGIGLFTNPDRGWLREKTEVIGVLAADGRQIYYENFLWDLLSAVGRRITSGRKLLYPINLFHTAGHVPESLAFLSMTGLIWLGPDFAPSAAADAFFAALTVPAVTVNDPRAGHSCISYDMELEGYQVGRKLLGEGRRSPVVIAKRPDMPQIAGLRRAFSESGTPFNDRLLVLRNPGMADRLHTIFDLLEMPEAIYAVGGMLRDIEPVLRERRPDFGRCRLIGESSVWKPDFRGWVVGHEYELLAETACSQLFAEIDGGPRRDHRIPRKIKLHHP